MASVQVIVQDDVDTAVVIQDPTDVTVVEIQLPGVQGPPGDGSAADLPSGGTAGQVLVKTGPGDSDITWAVPDVTQVELDAKLFTKNNGNVALDPTADSIASFRVSKAGAGAEAGWISKLTHWFSEDGSTWVPGWFVDKFMQLRARAVRDTESAFIAYPKSDASTVNIIAAQNAAGSSTYWGVNKNNATATVPIFAPNMPGIQVMANGGTVAPGTAAGTLIFERTV